MINGVKPREWSREIRNPLAQPGTVWDTVGSAELAAAQRALALRRVDPGGIFRTTEQLLGPVTSWTVLGDNVIGAWNWEGGDFAEQHRAVTTGAGAFIATAMRYLRISGHDAGKVLDALSPRTVSDLPVDAARFVLFTTTAGTVDEEALVIRAGEDEYLLSCGGGRPPGWLALVASAFEEVEITDSPVVSFNIKGPRRLEAVCSLIHEDDGESLRRLGRFRSCRVRTRGGGAARVLRTIIGYEVWAAPDVLAAVWYQLVAERPLITPCGWELLSTYRMECRDILFGLLPVDLHTGTTLFEVGAGWMLPDAGERRDYVGRTALLKARGAQRLWLAGLRALDSGAAPPPVGHEVLTGTGGFAGYVTSAAWSPRANRALGFAHLAPDCRPGAEVHVDGARWRVSTVPFGTE